MPRGNKKGSVRGEYRRNSNVKERAIALLDFFRFQIERGNFDVEVADWWNNGFGNGATLRIDIESKSSEYLPDS